MSVPIQVGVSYDSDLEKVEKVTIEVAKEVMKEVPGGVPTFEPVIRYHTFGDSSINFTVVLRCKEFQDQYIVRHEFIKRFGSKIVHIHVHDNNGDFDAHLGVGFGSINWVEVISAVKKINYRGALVVESKGNIGESIQTLKKLLK
ncbi:Mechanosensitive ion channel [Candidatus Kryptobacter tengchongensis]|nr:Mechanosensitive ion channel [Candidatus Kryptobacter tengchongensis]